MNLLQIDDILVHAIVKAARDGLAMASLKPVPTAISRYFQCKGSVSSIIGFVGPYCGSAMCNAKDDVACFMAGRMVGETYSELNEEAMDGFCEICNIIAGQTKAILSSTEYKFDRISVPSLIVGSSYFISSYKGMTAISVEFDLPEFKSVSRADSSFTVSMCLMKV